MFGVDGFKFNVQDNYGTEGELGVTAKRLLAHLAKQDSLTGNTYVITKSGSGKQTTYRLKPYDGKNAEQPSTFPDGQPMSPEEAKQMSSAEGEASFF